MFAVLSFHVSFQISRLNKTFLLNRALEESPSSVDSVML